jgi:hypothetical protein
MKPNFRSLLVGAATIVCALPALALDTTYVPVGPGNTPFFAAITDLAAHGYVEDEYFVSGTANIYQYDADLNIEVMTPDVPYTTRIMIRRPANPADFNGVVVFEMLNPTAGFDIDFIWQYNQDLLLRDGYIWVGQTIRTLAVNQLKSFNPVRYDPLSLVERGLTYDAFGDIAVLLRDPADPENPLAGYNVTHLLGTGYSQSEDWLTTFSNELHEAKLAWDGAHAFDGYLGAGGNAAAHPIRSGDPGALLDRFYLDDRRLNHVNVPYFRIHSETEADIFSFPAVDVRQPDSDVFRQWEVAGTTHADAPSTEGISATIQRDLGFPLPPCDAPTGDVAIGPFQSAALWHLTNWVVDGTAPPSSVYLTMDGYSVVRDGYGNAVGGIRIPELEVPTGTYLPFNSGLGPCFLAPTYEEFSSEELDSLYPNHGSYVSPFIKAVNRLRKDGYLLPSDAEAYKEKAAESEFGH